MKVFISHSHESQALAKQISDALRRVGLEVWDDTQILPGDNWAQEIARALAGFGSSAVIPALGTRSRRHRNQREEDVAFPKIRTLRCAVAVNGEALR